MGVRPSFALGLICVAALAGGLLGLLRPEPSAPARTAAPAPRVAETGDLRLTLPAGWREARPRRVPGVHRDRSLGLRSARAEAVLAQVAPGDATLLPAGLSERLVIPASSPVPVRAGEVVARRYDRVTWTGTSRTADVFVAPATGGTAMLVCVVDERYRLVAEDVECEPLLENLRLARGGWLREGPEAAFAGALPPAVERLNERRAEGRRRLAAAALPRNRAEAGADLAAAYGDARRALGVLSAGTPPSVRTLGLLGSLEMHHRRLGARAGRLDRLRYERSAEAIRRGEAALEADLEAWAVAAP